MKWHPAGSNGNDGNYSITKGTSASLLGSQSDTGRQIQKADLGPEQLFLLFLVYQVGGQIQLVMVVD